MLSLTLNGKVIPLQNDFSMRLTWKSAICDFEKIPSGYGLGLSFPINEHTRQIFGNPQRFSKYRTANDQKFPGFEARFSGVLLMAGTISVVNSSGGHYECTLIDHVGVLGEKQQEKSILDIEKFAQEIPWVNMFEYSPDNSPYCCFPIQNSFFFDEKSIKVSRIVTVPDPERPGRNKDVQFETEVMKYCYIKTTAGRVNVRDVQGNMKAISGKIDLARIVQDNNTYENGKVTVVSPFFYLNHILDQSLKANGFFIDRNVINEDPMLRRVCIYNNFDITKTTYGVASEIVYGSDYLEEWIFQETGQPVTIPLAGRKLYEYTRSYDQRIVTKNHLPKMKLGEELVSTQNLFNVCFDFLPNGQVNVLSREEQLKGEAVDLDTYFVGIWDIGQKKQVALKFVREKDNNDLVFTEMFTDLSDRREDIKPAVDTYGDLLALSAPDEGEIRFAKREAAFYEFKWITKTTMNEQTRFNETQDVLGWERRSIGYQDGWYEFGREQVEEIKTAWTPCWGNNSDGTALGQKAIVQQKGNMNAWRAEQQAFAPRLLIQFFYTLGSNELPDFSFEYEKETTGLFARYWKYWNPFWANRLPVTGEFDLPVNMLRFLIYNICRKYRTREGEFFIAEMSCDFYIDRIGTTEIKGFKV